MNKRMWRVIYKLEGVTHIITMPIGQLNKWTRNNLDVDIVKVESYGKAGKKCTQ